MVVVASRIFPPSVVHVRKTSVVSVIGEVSATPLMFVREALRSVKSSWSGLETVHFSIPEVTQPMVDVSFSATVSGFATRTMAGFVTCTVHDADEDRV